jgi:DnaJ-domain-containing protein 1
MDFLMQVMDIQEDIVSAPEHQLARKSEENEARINTTISDLAQAFDSNDLDAAQQLTIKLNYWYTIRKLINERFE